MNRQIDEFRIIAILRGYQGDTADRIAEALVAGGVRWIEVTLNSPDAMPTLKRWLGKYSGQVQIGMGTILNTMDAQAAIDNGAQFMVTPNTDIAVIEMALDRGIPIFPGAMTPTEIVTAWQAGATAVKLFPISSFGYAYYAELQGPLNHIPMMPTGGVDIENIGDFIAAGAAGVGMGGRLVPPKLVQAGDYVELQDHIQNIVTVAEKAVMMNRKANPR